MNPYEIEVEVEPNTFEIEVELDEPKTEPTDDDGD